MSSRDRALDRLHPKVHIYIRAVVLIGVKCWFDVSLKPLPELCNPRMQTGKVRADWSHMEYEVLLEMPGMSIEHATRDTAAMKKCPRYYDVVLC